MIKHKFLVDGDNLSHIESTECSTLKSGTSYIFAFDFAQGQQGLHWFCRFKRNGKMTDVEINNNECEVPESFIQKQGDLYVGVFATTLNANEAKRISTNYVKTYIQSGTYTGPAPKSLELWEKVYAIANEATVELEKAKGDFESVEKRFENTEKGVKANAGALSDAKTELEKELEAHKASFDHHDNSVTTPKLADGAVTGDKIDDGAVLPQHLSVEVVERINSNKFDGVIHYSELYDFDKLPVYDNYPLVYKIHDTDMYGENGGLLIVSGLFGKAYSLETGKEEPVLVTIYQTKIDIHYGTIEHRHSLGVEGNIATSWSEWKSEYADVDDAITKTDFATNSPGSGQYGKPGIVRLGHQQGFKMIDNALVLDAATVANINEKYSSLMPVTPIKMAYAVARATHQQIGDDYNTEDFRVVHESKQNYESHFFPLSKDSLPVSYAAVKKAMPYTVDENKNVQFKGTIGSKFGENYVQTNEFGVVGGTYNNSFGVPLSSGTLYIYIEYITWENYASCTHLKCSIDGTTILVPVSKLELISDESDGGAAPAGSATFRYNTFTTDYPQFSDAYYDDYMNTNDVVVYGVVCDTVAVNGYKISTDGKAEFTSLAVPHMYLTSPDNSIYKVTVNNNGDLETTKVTFDENGNEIIVPPDIEFE